MISITRCYGDHPVSIHHKGLDKVINVRMRMFCKLLKRKDEGREYTNLLSAQFLCENPISIINSLNLFLQKNSIFTAHLQYGLPSSLQILQFENILYKSFSKEGMFLYRSTSMRSSSVPRSVFLKKIKKRDFKCKNYPQGL